MGAFPPDLFQFAGCLKMASGVNAYDQLRTDVRFHAKNLSLHFSMSLGLDSLKRAKDS